MHISLSLVKVFRNILYYVCLLSYLNYIHIIGTVTADTFDITRKYYILYNIMYYVCSIMLYPFCIDNKTIIII